MAETRKEVEEALKESFLFPPLDPDERDRFIAAAHPRSRSGAAQEGQAGCHTLSGRRSRTLRAGERARSHRR